MKTNSQGTFVGRTADFFGPLNTKIEIIPIGLQMHDPNTQFSWKVRYGTVGVDAIGILAEGMNQKGLTAHVLLQEDAKMPELLPGNNKISTNYWLAYVLTTSASVKEAIDNLKSYQVENISVSYDGQVVPGIFLHVAVFDPSGNAALIEFNNGKLEVFEGPQYNVLTNAPNLHEQLANLAKVENANSQYSISELPGGAESKNRFVRATFNMANMAEPKSSLGGVINMNKAVLDIFVPAYADKVTAASAMLTDAWETRWHLIYDLKKKHMFFMNDDTGHRLNLDINKVNFRGKRIKYIDPEKTKFDFTI